MPAEPLTTSELPTILAPGEGDAIACAGAAVSTVNVTGALDRFSSLNCSPSRHRVVPLAWAV